MDGQNPKKTDLNKLALAAGQAKHWTSQELATELGLPTLSGMVNLVFSYQGGRNDVIIADGSIDQTKTYVFEIKIEGVSKSLGKGLKDWDVSNGNDTMISLLNPDEKDEDLTITFYFDGGHYKLPVHLNAGGSAMFNMSDIIMMQQPDSDGNKIPPVTLHGTAVLSAASADPQWINVGVSIGIFNVSTATCGGHCPYCTNFTGFRVQADIGTAPVGQDTEFSSWGLSSSGSWVDYTLQSSWSSSNIQIAQPSASTVGAFTGVSPGSFLAQAFASLPLNDACPDFCDTQGWDADATGTVTAPTATIAVKFSGSKSSGDNLSFPSGTSCSQNLGGPLACTSDTIPTWQWNVEISAVVSDDASKWTVTQTIDSGRNKGNYRDSSGLHAFDTSFSTACPPCDGPESNVLQQPSGQVNIFYLDGPGPFMVLLPGQNVDSTTWAANFTSHFCSTTVSNTCYTKQWYVKIIVLPGAVLDTANSQAALGTTSLNF